jgi:hypothetical protein
MAGNVELLKNLLDDLDSSSRRRAHSYERITSIYPFHLAASYLDGGSGCCAAFGALCEYNLPLRGVNRDGSGHTVLDKLFLSIIRSHTAVRADQIFTQGDAPTTFPAEEKDICGRWDADTPQVRALFAAGYTCIPTAWKHPFCHTAVQSVCHASIMIYAAPFSPNINDTSGLFTRNCFGCGEGLALGPLHLTVVAAFYLAEKGMAGETLFGILAVAVCLLSLGADSRQLVEICVDDFLGGRQQDECRHAKFGPAALMQAVPKPVVDQWTSECQTGWLCLFEVLQLHANGRQNSIRAGSAAMGMDVDPWFNPSDPMQHSDRSWKISLEEFLSIGSEDSAMNNSSDEDEAAASDGYPDCDLCDYRGIDVHTEWLNLPCSSPEFGLVWACIQTELLTYRRLAHGDDWVSGNFSMNGLLAWLRGDSQSFQTPLVDGKMMQTHTKCGWFATSAEDFILPTAGDVSRQYSMNMEDF